MTAERGLLFVPVHGLVCAYDTFDFAGLSFRRIPAEEWRMLEANWITDLYFDRYAASPRTFIVAEIEARSGEPLAEEQLAPVRQLYTAFVTAARLAARGALVDWHRVCPVLRIGAQNQRPVGSFRNRLWGPLLTEPRMIPGRRRKFGDRIEWRPPQAQFPQEMRFELTDDVAQHMGGWLALLEQVRHTAESRRVLRIIHDFERGQDPLFHPRARLMSVFAAFEALFGAFAREDRDAGIGVAVSRTLQRSGIDPTNTASHVEDILRDERNRLAHGVDVKRPLDVALTTAEVSHLLRIGIAVACKWIVEASPGETRTLRQLRRELRAV